jgi:hypothetical protein
VDPRACDPDIVDGRAKRGVTFCPMLFILRNSGAPMHLEPIDNIRPSPIQHESLLPALRLRIKLVNRVLYEVHPIPLQDMMENFQRDADPGSEVSEMERIAVAYLEFCIGRDLSLRRKRGAYRVLIRLSVGASPPVPPDAELSDDDVADLRALFASAIPPMGAVDTPPPWPHR